MLSAITDIVPFSVALSPGLKTFSYPYTNSSGVPVFTTVYNSPSIVSLKFVYTAIFAIYPCELPLPIEGGAS